MRTLFRMNELWCPDHAHDFLWLGVLPQSSVLLVASFIQQMEMDPNDPFLRARLRPYFPLCCLLDHDRFQALRVVTLPLN